MDMRPQITAVEFTADGIGIAYIRVPQDVRKNGLVWEHRVLVPFASDYEDEIEQFVEALHALLADALDDEDRAEPIDPEAPEEEEDDDDEAE